MALASNDSSPLFAAGAASTVRLIAYLIVGSVLMITDHRGHYLKDIRANFSSVIEPIYRVAALPARLARDASLALADRKQLASDNERLRQELLLTQARLNQLDAFKEQNVRLKELLDVQRGLGIGVQLARLINIELVPFRQRITLDVGLAQGVRNGQPVIDAHGMMGQVIEVLDHTSIALLITDPTHDLPVTIQRSGVRAIAVGGGAVDLLILRNISLSADVKVGDKLVTSGLGGRFPGGFPVGEIRDVKADATGMFAVATALPSATMDRSGEVLLLRELAEPVGPPLPAPDAAAATEKSPERRTR
jgi:rod shape-determining protein MreC